MSCFNYKQYRKKMGSFDSNGKKNRKKRCCSSNTVELRIVCRSVARDIAKTKTQLFVETERSYREYFIAHLRVLDEASIARTMVGRDKISPTESKLVLADFNEPVIVDFDQCGAMYLKRDPYQQIDNIIGFNPGFLTKEASAIYYSESFRLRVKKMLENPTCSGITSREFTSNQPIPNAQLYTENYYGLTDARFETDYDSSTLFQTLKVDANHYKPPVTEPPIFIHNKTGNVYASFEVLDNYGNQALTTWDLASTAVKFANVGDSNIFKIIRRARADDDLGGDYSQRARDIDITCTPIDSLRYFLFNKKASASTT